MSLTADFAPQSGLARSEIGLWSSAALVMLAVHVGAAWYLTREPLQSIGDQALAPPLLVELAPLVQTVAEQEVTEPLVAETPPEAIEPEAETPPLETAEPETAEPIETAEAVPEEPLDPVEEPIAEPQEQAEPETAEPETIEPALAEPEAVEPEPVEQEVAEAEPVEQAEAEPDVILPESDVPLPVSRPPPPRQVTERAEPRPQRQRPRAEPRQETRTERPRRATPPPAAASQPRVSRATTANWQRQVQARLNRAKRYPRDADGATGVARVRVSISGAGQVTGSTIVSSSGNAALDRAATAMMERAGRVPAPPDGNPKTLVVPVNFAQR